MSNLKENESEAITQTAFSILWTCQERSVIHSYNEGYQMGFVEEGV